MNSLWSRDTTFSPLSVEPSCLKPWQNIRIAFGTSLKACKVWETQGFLLSIVYRHFLFFCLLTIVISCSLPKNNIEKNTGFSIFLQLIVSLGFPDISLVELLYSFTASLIFKSFFSPFELLLSTVPFVCLYHATLTE